MDSGQELQPIIFKQRAKKKLLENYIQENIFQYQIRISKEVFPLYIASEF